MIAALLAWLFQDLLQVLFLGIMIVPEVFLLVVIYKILAGPKSPGRISLWIWIAFAGGLIWDLRWANTLGMSAVVNTICSSAAYWFWQRTPNSGRGVAVFALIASIAHVASGAAHYMAWAVPSQAAMRMFWIQQLLSIIPLVPLGLLFAFRIRRETE